jgi:hypothetical protein
MNKINSISLVLVILSIMSMSIGGLSDLTNTKLFISKEHSWFDGIYLAILAIFFQLLSY